MMKLSQIKSLLAALLLSVGGLANATLILDAGPSSTEQVFSGGNYVAGTEFTLSSGLTVDGLAFIDIGSDGLSEDHMVGLWDAAGNLLAQALVTNNSNIVASQSGLARWYVTEINDLFLAAGTYRVAGTVGEEANALSENKISIPGVGLSSGYVRNTFPSGGFNYPDLAFGSNAIRASLTASSSAGPAEVSSPATFALFALLLTGLLSRRFSK